MRRRAFITLLGSVAAALASDAHAQQQGRVWRVGADVTFSLTKCRNQFLRSWKPISGGEINVEKAIRSK